jgi:hypothetical protein
MHRTSHGTSWSFVAAICSALLLFQGCSLDFSGENFQRLKVHFKLSETLAASEATLVHSWFFPTAVKVRKRWVGVSGRLTDADEGALPSRVTVSVRFSDVATGRQQSKVSIKVNIDEDGGFSARKKLSKNIVAESMMDVSVEPVAGDLVKGTALALCVDVVEKKKDLDTTPDCVESEDGGSGDPVTLSELQASLFTPSCAVSGCHNSASARAGLILASGSTFNETVNVASSQRPTIDIIEPGDPESSYMVKKLRGDSDIDGARMPDGGPFLSAEQMAELASWINSGAPDN